MDNIQLHIDSIPSTLPEEDEYLLLQDFYIKGDDIQKLSVIQALPQLLQYDPNGTLTRIVPKIQQELPKSSCEFHVATSKIFKLLIEKQLPLNLTNAVIQGTESKDPVVSNAWIETLLAVISILPIEQIKANVIPLALTKSQPINPVYCRIASCKIFGKCAAHPKIQAIDVKTTILPAVQSLCQDCFQDVRATMCSQLHLIAQGLGENVVKSSLLPSLVELAADDAMSVRSAAVAASVLIIPYLNKETKITTIVPLIKQLCQKPLSGTGDPTFPTMAREYGKLVVALKNDLEVTDCIWVLQFYKTLATRGQQLRLNKDNIEVTQDVICREQCAFNLPAVTMFTVCRISNQLNLWHSIFSGLANDSCYLVRKTTAGCVYEVARILGPQCKIIKDDFIKLLRDDAEEVLQMLVPHVGMTLELLCANGVLSREQTIPESSEIAKALLKCHMELSKGFNWRIKTNFLQQLEHLPNCMPSDFIHQHFSPIMLNCVIEARPKPLRSQASKTLLIFLRYNVKEIQRKWIRDNLITHLCYAKSCYTRHIFILACVHAMELFSNTYFKKHFFEPLVSLSDDPVSNIRLCVIGLLPNLFKMLVLPEDRKLQTSIDNIFSKLDIIEKDKDVKDIIRVKLKEIKTTGHASKHEYMVEQRRKEEEENKIFQGKSIATSTIQVSAAGKAASVNPPSREQVSAGNRSHPSITRTTSVPSRQVSKAGHTQIPSEMSFLEQHFYIDAGISLPREKVDLDPPEDARSADICKVTNTFKKKLNIIPTVNVQDVASSISTVSVEDVDIDTMSESELKILETSTTNITDDVKVNLRKRNTKHNDKFIVPNILGTNVDTNLQTVIQTNCFDNNVNTRKQNFHRRSLNLGSRDMSRIPVSLKKSKSNADVKITSDNRSMNLESHSSKSINDSTININNNIRKRPKSEILINPQNKDKWLRPLLQNNEKMVLEVSDGDMKNNSIPITYRTGKDNNALKPSGLPVFQRRTASEARK